MIPRESAFVASILGYFDESGKFKDQNIVSFAGYAAGWSALESFDKEWEYLLRRHGLKHLTMKEALNHRKPLSGRVAAIGAKERTTVLMNFAECILKHFELGVSVSVDVVAFAALPSASSKILGKNPHYLAFSRTLGELKRYFSDDSKIAVICDDEDEYSVECYKLYRKTKLNDPGSRDKFTAISFADDTDHVPLQAADMLASLTRLETGRELLGTPYDYQSLTTYLMTDKYRVRYEAGMYGRNALNRLSASFIKAQREGKKFDPLTDK
jgi:hypothetical protein